MGVFYIGGREGRCGMFRRLCVGMILDLLLCDCVWVCVYVGSVVDVVECVFFLKSGCVGGLSVCVVGVLGVLLSV